MSQYVVNGENSQMNKARGQNSDMAIFRLREMHQLETVSCMTSDWNDNSR